MNIQSAKAKGRRLAQAVKDGLLKWAPDLQPDDILVTPSSVTGEDLMLSPRAREVYPFAIECKMQEKISIWESYKQAKSHAVGTERKPILVFSKNREEILVCLAFEDFMWLIR